MSLSDEDIKAAERMHRRAQDFERKRRTTPGIFLFSGGILALLVSRASSHLLVAPETYFLLVYLIVLFIVVIVHPHRVRRYEDIQRLLQILERDHGAELPWMKEKELEEEVARHLSAVRKLEREMAEKPSAL